MKAIAALLVAGLWLSAVACATDGVVRVVTGVLFLLVVGGAMFAYDELREDRGGDER